MQRIATMTVIRGTGECQAIVNGVVQKELQKIQENNRREVAYLNIQNDILRRNRNRLRDQLRAEQLHRACTQPSLPRRAYNLLTGCIGYCIALGAICIEAAGLHDFGLIDREHRRMLNRKRKRWARRRGSRPVSRRKR